MSEANSKFEIRNSKMDATQPVLQLRHVTKQFATPRGPVDVLKGVNVTLTAGSFVALTGPSGSGKSTFLNLAALLDTPSTGELFLDGDDVARLSEVELCAVRKDKIGMVFQKFCLMPHRSALDNVLFRFRYLDTPVAQARTQAEAALETVGLLGQADQPVRLMSGGEMQRVAVARAVAHRPSLLVADEPTGNLDRTSAAGVMDIFSRLHRQGITVLLVTHNEELLHYAQRHLILRDGRMEEAP
jgi:putative ABC transport system ATP-binding protein